MLNVFVVCVCIYTIYIHECVSVCVPAQSYLCACCFSNSGTTLLESVILQIQFAQSNLHKFQSFQTSHFDLILLNFIGKVDFSINRDMADKESMKRLQT